MRKSKLIIWFIIFWGCAVASLLVGLRYLEINQDARTPAAQSCAADEIAIHSQCFKVKSVLGQLDHTQTATETVDEFGIDHASGVVVDVSTKPNRVYVIDSGTSRVLGFSSLGKCSGTQSACTNATDCPSGDSCVIDGTKKPDIVLGQPNFTTSACNRDNNKGLFNNPTADTLCLLNYPQLTNTRENWIRINMDVDSQGNLYVPDIDNNRVLVYKSPLGPSQNGGGDARADVVLGQTSFEQNGVNISGTVERPAENSLYLAHGGAGYDHISHRSVSVDKQTGAVWVADTLNHRILRFPAVCLSQPAGCVADLVIGQPNFTAVDWAACHLSSENTELDRLCTPTNARVNPETGELVVIDERPAGFKARILIYTAPFTNGMSADRVIDTTKPGYRIAGRTDFQATGLSFNTNKQLYPEGDVRRKGELWITEHDVRRALLVDTDTDSSDGYQMGDIISVIGSPDKMIGGCNYQVIGDCNQGPPEKGFNLCWMGGNLALDDGGNALLADEAWSRLGQIDIINYKPFTYDNPAKGPVQCVPQPTQGLFKGTQPNSVGALGIDGGVGLTVYEDGSVKQLITRDTRRLAVWSEYAQKGLGKLIDFVIGQSSTSTKDTNPLSFGARGFSAIDSTNRLWLFNEHSEVMVFQLPLVPGAEPLGQRKRLYWADDTNTPIRTEGGISIAYHKPTDSLFLTTSITHRILIVKNVSQYTDLANQKLVVSAVLGQPNKSSEGCNFNQPEGVNPTATSLCVPTQATFDKKNNLYVVENAYECHGNNRITVFEDADITRIVTEATTSSVSFPLLAAKKVFNKPDFTSGKNAAGSCAYNKTDGPGSPVSVAFDSKNSLIIGNDGYFGSRDVRAQRQLWLYDDPLKKNPDGSYVQNQTPDGYLLIPTGAAGAILFDSQDNFIMQDHTWNKIWVINYFEDPRWLVRLTPPPTVPPTVPPTAPPTVPPTVPPTAPPTVPPTVPPTAPPTAPPTVPPTAPPTVPPTVPPTAPPTAPPTVPPTAPPTVPPTVPPTAPPTAPPTVPPTAPPTCSYNANIDGKNGVDIDDYVLLVQNFMKTGQNISGDIDCSGRVDIDDYSLLVQKISI